MPAEPESVLRVFDRIGSIQFDPLEIAVTPQHGFTTIFRRMEKEPNQAPEPTLTIRPFSMITATLETSSSLWVSVAHL